MGPKGKRLSRRFPFFDNIFKYYVVVKGGTPLAIRCVSD
ncbi:hypothetical protein VHA_002870 [Grimontia hollisae CIP 101886]|uniref:Uncharacterized protein n=1 Tax=Grimontia hollisae CIP 101886 TaxID=675812 RepID=D0IAU3_GRIHO|nr:hypothetical protein VHA_002870 [Grimontia hollisae CIP 101886]